MLITQVPPNRFGKRFLALLISFVLLVSTAAPAVSQVRVSGATVGGKAATKNKLPKKSSVKKGATKDAADEIVPEQLIAQAIAMKTTAQIMDEQAARGTYKTAREILRESGVKRQKKVHPDRADLPDGPWRTYNANRFPLPEADENVVAAPEIAAQTIGPSFNAVTGPGETGAFPPDTEAEVGPNSIVVHLNGRLRSFNKGTSVTAPTVDGVLNVDPDIFFASVMTPPLAGEAVFTTDPNIRYDRISNRWFLNMIDVPLTLATGALRPNRILLAVSNAASNGNITPATVWTFYQFQGDATLFADYQSFGVDASALYIGANMFTTASGFNSTKGFVIPKAPILTASPATVWAFSGLVATPTGAGPLSPRGADNTDPANIGPTAIGYFVGVDNALFNTLMMRRVTNPGSIGSAPTISANISIPTPLTTRFPVLVPHLGNTGGTGGRLDALDDRLFSAMVRNGRLWTAHNIGVNNTGVAGATNNRNAARWYELQNLNATPSVLQSGTLFDDNAVNDANQRNYWIPTIAVSGQGHAVLGVSIAGTNERINAFVTGRQAADTLGTMREGPGGAALPGYTASATAYNPPSDPGGPSRRWGDYSATTVDPLDDMTMWTFQEYNNGTNTYGVRGVRLIAPPPPTPAALTPSPISTSTGLASTNIVVTGVSVNGSAFFDPGANLAPPALPFNHLAASIAPTAGSVNSITYNSPTQVTVNLNTVGATAGLKTITITNPDGQTTSVNITLLAPTAAPAGLGGRISNQSGQGIGGVRVTAVNAEGTVTFETLTNPFGYYRFDSLPTGEGYIVTPLHKRYSFSPGTIFHNHLDEFSGLNFGIVSLE